MKKKKGDIASQMAQKEALVTSKMIKEASAEDQEINMLIRERYSMSQEFELHRKKLNGTLEDEKWDEYNNYVEECIAAVREKRPPNESE